MKYKAFCKFELIAASREEAISEMLELFPAGEQTRGLLASGLEVREQVGATVVHKGIALPHCRSILVDRLTIAIGRSAEGIPWPLEKVHTVVLFISPVKPNGAEEHSIFLSHIARCIRDSGDRIAAVSGQQELLDLLNFQTEEQEG